MSEEIIIKTEYSDVMQKSYIDYAMSVIVARALPDVRDGLKPVQRRTLYDMHELGIRSDRPYRKCARIVGDTMGKYHPHGDSSIYEALVVMSQEFKKGLPLVLSSHRRAAHAYLRLPCVIRRPGFRRSAKKRCWRIWIRTLWILCRISTRRRRNRGSCPPESRIF